MSIRKPVQLEVYQRPKYLYISLPRPCRLQRIMLSTMQGDQVAYEIYAHLLDRCTDFHHPVMPIHEYRAHFPAHRPSDWIRNSLVHALAEPPHALLCARSRADRFHWLGELHSLEIKGNKVRYLLVPHPKSEMPDIVRGLGDASYLQLQEATLLLDNTRNLGKVSSFLKINPSCLST